MLISYEDQKKNQDLMKTMLEELIKSNKNQEKINNILLNSIINDKKK